MIETICYAIALVFDTVFTIGFGVYSYHLGRKDGLNQAVINVCKDEGKVNENE